MSLEAISALSRRYGANPDAVLAGGGNTSYKTDATLYIKSSGAPLASMKPEDFVGLDRAALAKLRETEFDSEPALREKQVLEAMMAARLPGSGSKRPSVETLLHDLFDKKYVLHVHPAVVNGLTCSVNGKKTAAELFPDAVWVDETEPGYVLASVCAREFDVYRKRRGVYPDVLILQNHGVFFAGDTTEEIDAAYAAFTGKIKERLTRLPDFSAADIDLPAVKAAAANIAPVLRMKYDADGGARVKFAVNREILRYAASTEAFAPLVRPLTPDHIVYCKAEPLYIADADPDKLAAAFDAFTERRGFKPRVVFVKDVGMFSIGGGVKGADITEAVWFDAMKITAYADAFGKVRPMSRALEDFIVNWEVESYRAGVSASSDKRSMSGKIVVVTGSAQGFGKGIAESFAEAGADVVIADMNAAGAAAVAAGINEKYGNGSRRAISVAVNVSDESSVAAMVEETVLNFGGLDVFVNNAGIVRAGSLEEMTKGSFELVASVNYTAYFLCVKYASAVMKHQRRFSPGYMSDIIEINSKSGLEGSNKNFAYAGSKFGGIGLTQSFALELAPFGIKVNAVCPGNFLDGPLWSDPEKGLFVQYLNAGKVPGAKTVADVRAFYEAKVPLGRGCGVDDVMTAVFYIIAQKYETGQALPVTGGQVMLN